MASDPVFEEGKCGLPFIERIQELPTVESCLIPEPPTPSPECADMVIPAPQPQPVEVPDPLCPQIQGQAQLQIVETQEQAMVQLQVTKLQSQECAFDFDFKFKLPPGIQGPPGPPGPPGPTPEPDPDDCIYIRSLVSRKCITIDDCVAEQFVFHTYRYCQNLKPVFVSVTIERSCKVVKCAGTDSGGGSGGGGGGGSTVQVLDRWRPCSLASASGSSGIDTEDIFLDRSIFEIAESVAPGSVIKLDGENPCYDVVEFDVVGVETPFSTIAAADGCDAQECTECECTETCVRLTHPLTGEWVEVSVAEGESACLDGFREVTAQSDLSIDIDGGIYWNSDTGLWEAQHVNGVDEGGAWSAHYSLNAACPYGSFTLLTSLTGSPPESLDAVECATVCGDLSSTTSQPNPTLVNTDPSDSNTENFINYYGPYVFNSYASDGEGGCIWTWVGAAVSPQHSLRIALSASGVFTAWLFTSEIRAGDFLTQTGSSCSTGVPKVVTGIKTSATGILVGSFDLESIYPGGGCDPSHHTILNVTLG
jgi:hypothetical protein